MKIRKTIYGCRNGDIINWKINNKYYTANPSTGTVTADTSKPIVSIPSISVSGISNGIKLFDSISPTNVTVEFSTGVTVTNNMMNCTYGSKLFSDDVTTFTYTVSSTGYESYTSNEMDNFVITSQIEERKYLLEKKLALNLKSMNDIKVVKVTGYDSRCDSFSSSNNISLSYSDGYILANGVKLNDSFTITFTRNNKSDNRHIDISQSVLGGSVITEFNYGSLTTNLEVNITGYDEGFASDGGTYNLSTDVDDMESTGNWVTFSNGKINVNKNEGMDERSCKLTFTKAGYNPCVVDVKQFAPIIPPEDNPPTEGGTTE